MNLNYLQGPWPNGSTTQSILANSDAPAVTVTSTQAVSPALHEQAVSVHRSRSMTILYEMPGAHLALDVASRLACPTEGPGMQALTDMTLERCRHHVVRQGEALTALPKWAEAVLHLPRGESKNRGCPCAAQSGLQGVSGLLRGGITGAVLGAAY